MKNLLTAVVQLLKERGSLDVYDVMNEFEVGQSTAHAALAALTTMRFVAYIHVDKRRLYELTELGKSSRLANAELPNSDDSPIPTWALLTWSDGNE